MPIPDYQTIMLPLLQKVGDKKPHSIQDLIKELADFFQLTEEERAELQPSGRQRIFHNRVYWAKKYLSEAGLLENDSRNTIKVTKEGVSLLKEKLQSINNRTLERFEKFRSFKGKNSTPDIPQTIEETHTPEEIIENVYKEMTRVLTADLIEKILTGTPQFFEKLVLDVLVTMGYGGSHTDVKKAIVGRSNDGGIDGIIKEDKLGLDAIYLQAKRWSGTVGRPEVQSFAGALDGVRAKKGIFITTSTFSQGALDYVNGIEKKIVLINGEQLAGYMIDYNVGVSTINIYALKRIDSDYFEE
jgi:restriction system protein